MWAGGSQFILDAVKFTANERDSECIPPSHHQSQRLERRNSDTSPAVRPGTELRSPPIITSSPPEPPLRVHSGDTSVMRPRLTANHFVGRIGELAELELALHEASEGRPGVVLLGGESGIGKTRLVSEFEPRSPQRRRRRRSSGAARRGGRATRGRASLRPAAERAAAACARPPPRTGRAQPGEHFRARGLAAAPARADGRAPSGRSGGDPGSQLGLFEALLELLDLIGSQTPVAFVLEDIHWADRSTRALPRIWRATCARNECCSSLPTAPTSFTAGTR